MKSKQITPLDYHKISQKLQTLNLDCYGCSLYTEKDIYLREYVKESVC